MRRDIAKFRVHMMRAVQVHHRRDDLPTALQLPRSLDRLGAFADVEGPRAFPRSLAEMDHLAKSPCTSRTTHRRDIMLGLAANSLPLRAKEPEIVRFGSPHHCAPIGKGA